MNKLSRKIILHLFIILFCSPEILPQINYDKIKLEIDSLLTTDYFTKTQIAVDVFDLTSSQKVYSKNEKLLLRPASVQKIFTTGAALKFLGPDYTFKTGFYYTGEIEDSVCKGDIYIIGGFDPDFTNRDLDSIVNVIKEYGINEVNGNLYADVSAGDSLFWGEGWMWDDDPGSFSPYLSPLCINDNSIKIIFRPGEIGKPAIAEVIPQNRFINVINNSITIDTGKSTINVTRDWINRSNEIIITGNIPSLVQRDSVSLNIFNPTFYFLNLMKESLEKHNIKLNGRIDTLTSTNDAEEIITFSRNIEPVIINTNKESDNLSAEMILRSLAFVNFSKPSTAKKGKVFVDSLITLAGFTPKDYRIADGSGLSFYNLISAELVTGLLKYFYYEEEELFVKLFNSFAVSGFDGTLKNRMVDSPVQRRVFAKTGGLSGVANIAGFIRTKNGSLIAFTILTQNYVGRATQALIIQNKICELLFEGL